jgi:hypothetical protein
MKFWFLFSLFFLTGLTFTLPEGWSLKKEKGNIKVYTRTGNSSSIKELKIVMRINGSLASLVAALDDVEEHPAWVYKCSNAKRLDIASTDGYYYYVAVDFPFPAVDRDVVIFTSMEYDEKSNTVITHSVATPDEFPLQDGYIRVRHFNSKYEISARVDGMLDVVYEMFTDPGGHIPAWMVNMAIAKGPIKTMQNLEIQAQKAEYANALLEEAQ